MRIGILCHSSFGGSARIATDLAIELANRNHTVHLFAHSTPFGRWETPRGLVLHQIEPKKGGDVGSPDLYVNWNRKELQEYIASILQVIFSEGLDVLHFHYAVPFAFIAAEVKRLTGTASPVMVGTLHGTDVSTHGKNPFTGPKLANALVQMDEITTVSTSHARLATRAMSLPSSPIVIPNFVDLCTFYPASTGHPAADSTNRPRITHISNFRPVKQPQHVAKIFLEIRKVVDAELWLVGDGEELDEVKAIIRQNGAEDRVRYWGLRHDVSTILSQSTLLLMSSLTESFCLTALEAMACGVPVLATRVGGVPEIVADGQTGILFDVGDQETAAREAVTLLSDPSKYATMRAAGIQRASRFGRRRIVPRYEALYRELLDERGERAAFRRRSRRLVPSPRAFTAVGG